MGVYVIRNQPNYLRAGLFGQAFNVLGDQIGGMIKRSQDAAEAKGLQKSIGLFSEAMRPKKGLDVPAWEPVEDGAFSPAINKYLNNNMVSKDISANVWNTSAGLGKDVVGDVNDFTHALSQINPKHIPYVAELGKSLYGDRIANQEKERYGASTRDTLLANGGLDRNNPNLSFVNLVQLAAQGVDVSDALKSFYAPMQGNVVDTGTKKHLTTFNPVSGDHTQGASMDVEVSPDVAHEAASRERVAKIGAGAAYAAANKPKFSFMTGTNGEILVADGNTGRVYDAQGNIVENPRVTSKGMSLAEQTKLEEMVSSQVQLSKGNKEDFMRRITLLKTQNPQYAGLIDQIANSSNIWGPKSLFGERKVVENPFYSNPAVIQWRKAFPEDTANMTDEQVLAEIQRQAGQM